MFLFFWLQFGCKKYSDYFDRENEQYWGEYLVVLDETGGSALQQLQFLSDEYEIPADVILGVYDHSTTAFLAKLPHRFIDTLKESERITDIIENTVISFNIDNDYEPVEYSYGENEVPHNILRVGGPYEGDYPLQNIHVAVIDSGIDPFHPDLHVVAEVDLAGYSRENDSDHDNFTYVAAEEIFKSASALDDEGNFDPYKAVGDDDGHGTHVAGIIGALADEIGIVGISPNVSLHSLNAIDGDSGDLDDILKALEYVLIHPEIRVVNISMGWSTVAKNPEEQESLDRFNALIKQALQKIENKGIIVCIAAGNITNATPNPSTDTWAPASYDVGIIVSNYNVSILEDGTLRDEGFSVDTKFGSVVDITAPGTNIISTYPSDELYGRKSGTSQATPLVSGAIAAFLAHAPLGITPTEVREILIETAETNIEGQNENHPEPLLNFKALMERTLEYQENAE